jgi:hypothetical protein
MDAQQYYYTSYVHTATGKAGFQIKAMSAGIPPDLQATLAHLIAYRIPPPCNIQDYGTHPIALRYVYEGPGRCILLCSQSCGNDEYSRPGNFFAHALLLEEELFTRMPPVFFWKSSFWQRQDLVEREQIVSLPTLPISDAESTIDYKKIRQFLAQGSRRAWLHKLLCAIIHSNSTQRRIVILDSAEHVALWIAAASCLLPPACRPLLTFATYHHDPYQVQYLITGTTKDSSFRATPEDHLSYFVLNAQEGLVSAVDPSPYAWLAAQAASSGSYEETLQPFFTAHAHYFPDTMTIDERLDLLVLYANTQYNLYQNRPATTTGMRLPSSSCELVQSAISALPREEYKAIIELCISAFMQTEVSYASYLQFIQALFSTSQRMELPAYFWQVYLNTWHTMLQHPASVNKAIEMLNFWFALTPSDLPDYQVQQCLLLLSAKLRRERATLQTLIDSTAEQPWHASLQLITMPRNNALAQLSQRVTAIRQYASREWFTTKRRSSEYEPGESRERRTLEEEMSLLFASDNTIEQYQQYTQMYTSYSLTRFWSCYWQHFTRLLISHDVDRVFSILSFWFEHSYNLLSQQPQSRAANKDNRASLLSKPILESANMSNTDSSMDFVPGYLPQEFFLGLGEALERALQIRQVHAIAPLLQHKGLNGELYPWYPIIASYFHGEPCNIS